LDSHCICADEIGHLCGFRSKIAWPGSAREGAPARAGALAASAEATVDEGRGSQRNVGERKRACRASSAAPRRVAATTGTRAVATQTGTPVEEVCADDVDHTSLPDDAFALVLTAIDQPQAAARMLATCRRVRLVVPGPGSGPPVAASELGPSAPLVVQVQAMLAFLRSPAAKSHRLGLGAMAPRPHPPHRAATSNQ